MNNRPNAKLQWTNEPSAWRWDGNEIIVRSDRQTDFWRLTHDGGIRDNGHFFHQPIRGDFDAQICVRGQYQDQYDQAGLMVRIDAANWLKCGVELKDGIQYASAVVTRDYSDWSVVRLDRPKAIWLQVQRRAETFEVGYSLGGQQYQLLRQAYLPVRESVETGPMIASPIGDGFEATFSELQFSAT
jgi:regulation of enolase protein 1 (concanavalin A-like superfamily)